MKFTALVYPLLRMMASASPHTNQYVVDESTLSALIDEPPSFASSAEANGIISDIISLGSVTRMDYLTAQIETWASHRSVRHYWGFSELQDFDQECASLSEERRASAVENCKAGGFKDPKINSFASEYYGLSEGNRIRSNDPGWMCAQRRVGRAFGWIHSQYADDVASLPDYLLVVDDDTYVDLVDVMNSLEEDANKSGYASAFARAGCVFEENGVIPFPIAYGGFGTILNKAAIKHLSETIYCNDDASKDSAICSQIKADKIGEASVFNDGMSIFELFYKYSALKDFCMHSDWLLGYVLKYYLPNSSQNDEQQALVGLESYPSCGNVTKSGEVRPCVEHSDTCHNQEPRHMEMLALHSFAKSPESYKAAPKMQLTGFDVVTQIVQDHARETATSKFAYASVLGWNPSAAQNKIYLDATRVLIRSLKDSKADYVVLMSYYDEVVESLLKSEGAIVKQITPMKHSIDIDYFEPWFVDIAFSKLRAFELTEYTRVQLLDVDTAVWSYKNMDELFTSYPGAKLVAEGLGNDSPIRAGWLMIRPSIRDFRDMQQLLERGVFSHQRGWDAQDLAVEYPGWKVSTSTNNWEFYGSQLEQGLLFHHFYAQPKSLDSSKNDRDLLSLLDDKSLWGFGFIHFYGEMKPWADVDFAKFPFRVKIARDHWLRQLALLDASTKEGVTNLEHESPLTSKGVAQYRRAQSLYSPTASPSNDPDDPTTLAPSPHPTKTPRPTNSKANKAVKAQQISKPAETETSDPIKDRILSSDKRWSPLTQFGHEQYRRAQVLYSPTASPSNDPEDPITLAPSPNPTKTPRPTNSKANKAAKAVQVSS